MPRTSLRLVGAVTALLVVGALAPASASPAAEPPAPKPVSSAPEGIAIGDTALSSDTFAALPTAEPSSRAQWPIGGGSATLTDHPATATDEPSQKFTRVQLNHYRAYGGVLKGVVQLGAAPTAATNSIVVLALGRLNDDGTSCNSAAGHNISFTSTDTDTQNNPVYRGSTITVRPFQFAPARTASWNCAFAQTRDVVTPETQYDAVAGRASLFRQKPILTIRTKARKLERHGFTRVPIIIRNSPATVATAPNVRLSWRTRGVKVKANPRVGNIRPGTSKRGAFFVKDTRRGNGTITFIVTSRDYKRRLTLTVRETRR